MVEEKRARLRREARVLRDKALSSLRRSTSAFNAPDDDGRTTTVLLTLQHAFEMLLKAALVQTGQPVFDKTLGRSISFEKCLKLARQTAVIKLTDGEAGTLRAIDALRDDEQHWFNDVDEQFLYLHTRAGITLFDDLLLRVFSERLADHLPQRVLPLSTDPPRDLQVLIDSEYQQIAELLRPGRRARATARARIRTLLAMEAHVDEDAKVSERDVDRVERGVKDAKARELVFPRLGLIEASTIGQGATVSVRFDKRSGAPVRLISADDTTEAAAIREVDLQRKYHRSPRDLAEALGLTGPKCLALRQHLGVDVDDSCHHHFVFGSQRHRQYSDNAFTRMRDALRNDVSLEGVWAAHRPRRSGQQAAACSVPGCHRDG